MNLCQRDDTPRLRPTSFVATFGLAAPAVAQTPLTLTEAIARARAHNPDAGASAAAEREAAQRLTQARAGYLPKVDVAESWQRGNQPVFVFSSLLAQRQFTAADFALNALNHPDAVDNFRSAVMIEQSLFDGATRASVAAAGIGRDMAATARTMVDHDLAASVTSAYGRVLVATAASQSAAAAAETARADRALAGNRRDAGLVTDADVLQIDVYLSRTREQQIRAAADERIARAQLNQLMGEPLGEVFALELYPGHGGDRCGRSRIARRGSGQEPAGRQARGAAGAVGGCGSDGGTRGVSAAGSGAGWMGIQWRRLELALLELGRRRRRADQRLSWIRRQGAARRSTRAGGEARTGARESGHGGSPRRPHGRRTAGRGPGQRSGRPRRRGPGAREPADHPRSL